MKFCCRHSAHGRFWTPQQPATVWQAVTPREGAKGPLRVVVLHRRVGLWDGEEALAQPWRLIVRREINDPTAIQYSLRNAPADTPASRLAFLQGQRYRIEPTLQPGNQATRQPGRRAGRRSSARLAPLHGPGHNNLTNGDRCSDKVELEGISLNLTSTQRSRILDVYAHRYVILKPIQDRAKGAAGYPGIPAFRFCGQAIH